MNDDAAHAAKGSGEWAGKVDERVEMVHGTARVCGLEIQSTSLGTRLEVQMEKGVTETKGGVRADVVFAVQLETAGGRGIMIHGLGS